MRLLTSSPTFFRYALPPMNQMDATATPMFDCFTNTPDFTAFDAVTNQVPLDKEDQCPEDLFNQILWRAVKGPQVPYPLWAVKAVEDDD